MVSSSSKATNLDVRCCAGSAGAAMAKNPSRSSFVSSGIVVPKNESSVILASMSALPSCAHSGTSESFTALALASAFFSSLAQSPCRPIIVNSHSGSPG